MNQNKKIVQDLKEFILSQKNVDYEDQYHLSVVKGILHLFRLKEQLVDKDKIMQAFFGMKDEILTSSTDRFVEELIDELNAVLIQFYPMPDFWNSSLSDFKNHKNFKKYFDLLESKGEKGS